MTNIGFSTGCLYRSNLDIKDRIKLFLSLGATAMELSFTKPCHLNQFKLTSDMIKDIKKFSYISIHAPWKEVEYDSDTITNTIIQKLKSLCEQLPINGIVVHPNTINDFSRLLTSGLPILIENMDKRKKFGTTPKHFKELKKYDFGFILDIQHAYEHDPSMGLAKELIDIMDNKLRYIHISGCTKSELHFPTYLADNKGAIIKILKLNIKKPKILEGILIGNIKEKASEEFSFINTYEK